MSATLSLASATPDPDPGRDHALACLAALERKALWLSTYMIHHANNLRPKRDKLKVGGHQASCASISTLMTALYFHALRPEDRVAVKPHASPMFHAIQYLMGRQSLENLQQFRAFGGAQSYPSRTKDQVDVDFSTGSVGLGAAITCFASLVQDYLDAKAMLPAGQRPGRMIALVGDAELDEGNIYECLQESWKNELRNCWWIIDYNRQSLDGIVQDQLFRLIDRTFRACGWNVVTLKYGAKLRAAFEKPGGRALKRWINQCPNDVYSALTFQGGEAWRRQILTDMPDDADLRTLLGAYDDTALEALVTNLGGNDLPTVLDAFSHVEDSRPTCFIAYTIKGYGLPLAGHKDNHAGIMTAEQMADFQRAMGVPEGAEWDRFTGTEPTADVLERFMADGPLAVGRTSAVRTQSIPVTPFTTPAGATASTQEAFGRILNELARRDDPLSRHVVSTSPDVTISTNLAPWVNQRGLFHRHEHEDVFRTRKVASPLKWVRSRAGQHIELGIAENNLFLLLAALGLSEPLFGTRLLPVGTLYDPFIARGLDALTYACYQDARFMLVATPSGITLAPEGGAHQSVYQPLIGIGQPGLTAMEPAYADELAEIMRWGFEHMQAADGGSVYLRLSTRPLDQPQRTLGLAERRAVIDGGYWRVPPGQDARLAIAYCGAIAPEAAEAHSRLAERRSDIGLLAVTSADRLLAGWNDAQAKRRRGEDAESHVERLLAPLAPDARLVTVLDGHPATLAWLGSVLGHKVTPLGIDRFGQSGDVIDLYHAYGIDADAITAAAEQG